MKFNKMLLFVSVFALFVAAAYADNNYSLPLSFNDVVCDTCCTEHDQEGNCTEWHRGVDLMNSKIGAPFYSIANNGVVVLYRTNAGSYGGDGVPGKVLFVRYHKPDGHFFIAQYGHIRNVPEKYQIQNAVIPSVGTFLGELADYDPCMGGGGSCPHMHFGIWDSDADLPENHWGYGPNMLSWTSPMRFISTHDISVEFAANGEATNFGSPVGDVHVWNPNPNGPLYVDGFTQRCYIRDYSGGNFWSSAIVFDAYGGARKAYTVRSGFWTAWSQQGGPTGELGMPISNEYNNGGSTSRQDFQKGYLYYDGSTVTSHPSNYMPGRTSTGWNHQYSYLFALACERNGARNAVGEANGLVETYNSTLRRQKFHNGTFQDCWVMYDPNNHVDNPLATNEAYLLRTGFLEEYQHDPVNQNYNADGWPSAYGCPSRDEYHVGDPNDAIQFFVVRDGDGTHQHHMYFDYSRSTNDPDRIKWNSTYTTAFASQTPSGQFNMAQGSSRTFTVKFVNTGQFTWHNDPDAYPYDYVELKSCDSTGATCNSFLNYPYDGSLGWLNSGAPCTMQESSVAPGDTATFVFKGYVPSNASLGLHQAYFRPNHSVGDLMDDWGHMNFQVNVVRRAKFDFDGDGIADYWDRTTTGLWHLDYASNNLTGWDRTFYGYGGSQDTPCPADFDNDGRYDIAVLRNSDRKFLIDYAVNGFGSYDTSFSGYGGARDYPCPADYDGDRKDDISVRDTVGQWHIDYAANGFGSWDWTGSNYGGFNDRPCPADYDGDGKADLTILRNSDRKYLIDYKANGYTGWDETALGGYGGFADYPCPADYNGDGKDDIAVLNTTDRNWRVDHTGNGFGSWDYVLSGYGGSGDRPCPGDYAGDGWVDIACYHASISQFCIDYGSSQQNYGSWDWCDAGAWHPTWKLDAETTAPLTFSLSQNYPNPFNPITMISYSLPTASHVTLAVYNVLGQKVATLIDSYELQGEHSVEFNGSHLSSGVYFYRLKTDDALETKKMLILK